MPAHFNNEVYSSLIVFFLSKYPHSLQDGFAQQNLVQNQRSECRLYQVLLDPPAKRSTNQRSGGRLYQVLLGSPAKRSTNDHPLYQFHIISIVENQQKTSHARTCVRACARLKLINTFPPLVQRQHMSAHFILSSTQHFIKTQNPRAGQALTLKKTLNFKQKPQGWPSFGVF